MKLCYFIVFMVFFLFVCVGVVVQQVLVNLVIGNVVVIFDYMFCGFIQIWGCLVIQGGVDYMNLNGFVVGFWGLSISECSYFGGVMELDLYVSYG